MKNISNFEAEASQIKSLVDHYRRFEVSKIRKHYKNKMLEDVNEIIPVIKISENIINRAIVFVNEEYGIKFSKEQMIAFAKLHPLTFYYSSEEEFDSGSVTSLEQLKEDICLYFVEFPTIKYGHELTDEETRKYYQYVKDAAKIFGFEVDGFDPDCLEY